jgi:hypothetical protein
MDGERGIRKIRMRLFLWLAGVSFCAIGLGALAARGQVQTTLQNYFMDGTQPITYGMPMQLFIGSTNDNGSCDLCHTVYANPQLDDPIFTRWKSSMMGQAARDPLMHAAMAIANQDVAFSGDLCLRCHAPVGWLEGRSTPTDGSMLAEIDYEGVSCNFCHRMLEPQFAPGYQPPPQGDDIIRVALQNQGILPVRPGNGMYVVDPDDSRRGPFPFRELAPNEEPEPPYIHENYHFPYSPPIIYSPFHTGSSICGTCHDVSNPAYVRQPNGTFTLNALGQEHPTGDPADMFPIERTYSEWLNSAYATTGVNAGGVFGGNHPTGLMRTCQDCHMPDTESYGCAFDNDPFYIRPDVPAHDFNGGNAWVQDVLISIQDMYPDLLPGYLPIDEAAASKGRATYMLENAATLVATSEACNIHVRVINETGHKLPTGYPEGRRMWITVDFRDANLAPVATRGEYNTTSAALTTADTKVYEVELGLDQAVANLTGNDVGPSFHFALNNKVYKDNRIPPRGFTNAAYASFGGAPVGETYADGEYWDDTLFRVPPGATSAVVTLHYQTASKEYIEFLRHENHTNDWGDLVYEQWELTGKSAPVLMHEVTVTSLTPGVFADVNCSGSFTVVGDYVDRAACFTGPSVHLSLGCEAFDSNLDHDVDLSDFAALQRALSAP